MPRNSEDYICHEIVVWKEQKNISQCRAQFDGLRGIPERGRIGWGSLMEGVALRLH